MVRIVFVARLAVEVPLAFAVSGAIQRRDTGEFLSCEQSSCSFGDVLAQFFTEENGKDGQSKFVISSPPEFSANQNSSLTGYDGLCLDREHCHNDGSNSRASDCDHCGAVHWTYDEGSGHLSEDGGSNCLQKDGSMRHCSDKNRDAVAVNFVKQCDAKYVKGFWQYYGSLPADKEVLHWHHGTANKKTESKLKSWGLSVSAKVKTEWILADGEAEDAGTAKIHGEAAYHASSAYSSEWTEYEDEDYTITWGAEDKGKVAWQFVFYPTDECGHTEHSLVKEFALTENADRKPCCIPGYSNDIPYYRTCTSESAMVKDGSARGCKIDAAPKAATAVASNFTAFHDSVLV